MRKLGLVLLMAGLSAWVVAAPVGAGEPSQTSDGEPDLTPGAPTAQQQPSIAQVPPSSPTLYFSIDDESQLYSLDTTTAAPTPLGPTGVDDATVGLAESPDPAQLIGSTFEDLSVINADGSGFTTAGTDLLEAEGLAFDPVNSILYKIINEDFATANLTTGETIDTLASPEEDLEGLAWRGTDGRVYGFGGSGTDELFAYTPGTDTWDLIGSTGIAVTDSAGLAWDPNLDVLYAIGEDGVLHRIDPDTAQATEIGDTGISEEEQGGGLAFLGREAPPPPPPAPEAAVPVAAAPRFTG